VHFSISSLSCCIHQNLFLKSDLTMIELLPLPMKYLYTMLAGGSWRAYFNSAAWPAWTPDCSLGSCLETPSDFDLGVLLQLLEESMVSPSSSRSKELPAAPLLGYSLVEGYWRMAGVTSPFSSLSFFQKQKMSFSLIYAWCSRDFMLASERASLLRFIPRALANPNV
jgi:hypothetical protein